MTGNRLTLFILALLFASGAFAQADPFPGTWHMNYAPGGKTPVVNMEFFIGSAEDHMLYPAQLKLTCDSFAATYNLLLVKRNIRQLAIGRNKIATAEGPFSLGNWTIVLNGTLDLSRDIKGQPLLSVSRIVASRYGADMPDMKSITGKNGIAANTLTDFLKNTEIQMRKKDASPWTGNDADSILHSPYYGKYYGILDTVYVNNRDCSIEFPGNKKTDNGIISVLLNGSTVIDQAYLGYKKPKEEIRLDTGMNILVFYAENYGKTPATTGKMLFTSGKKKLLLNFADRKDAGATFIVARVVYYPVKEERNDAENELSKLSSDFQTQNSDNVYYYPKRDKNGVILYLPANPSKENSLLRDAKLLGNVEATSKQITLAIWDDAVEDGDSISLSINGKWVVQGLAVKKRPQFIIVTLEPGPNKITFIADNLGAIIPNTSVLEIIDGKKRRSFMIDTDLTQNNLVNILYDSNQGL